MSIFGNILVAMSMTISAASLQAAEIAVQDGVYVTDSASHYKDQQIELSAWGDGFTMKATLLRDGREYETEAFVRPDGRNMYSGSGTILVRYSDTTGCKHKFGVRIFVTDRGLDLRENTPRYIPFNPRGACTAAGPYVWFNHEGPYNLQQ